MSGAGTRVVRAVGSPIAAMLVAVVIGMQPAHANDRKTFPGSSCQGWGNVNAEIAATDGGPSGAPTGMTSSPTTTTGSSSAA